MADRYWVGVSDDWHDANNWAASSGGAGGAGVPTLLDDVYFDSFGQAWCQPASAFACNNMTLEVTATHIFFTPLQGGVIQGDFAQHEGYFGPTGGGGYTVDFQGDWLYDGGSFSVGTGVGVDPTCEFSGATKTAINNNLASASFQNVLVSGTYTLSGTRLTTWNIAQQLSVTGTMTIYGAGVTMNQVYLDGINASFGTLSGTIDGGGRFVYRFRDDSQLPITGTIKCRYFKLLAAAGLADDPLNEDLKVDGWVNVNQDFTPTGVEPWIDEDDGDTNMISIAADAPLNEYDEYYTVEDVDPVYTSVTPTNVRVHVKGRLYEGVGGAATLMIVTAWVWDGSVWQNGGSAIFNSTAYEERTCSNIASDIDTLAKLNGMRIKIELALIIDGGADKGGLNITEVFVEVDGTAYRPPIFNVAPRTWTSPCEVEIEYTDDLQTFEFDSGARHYFMNRLTIHGNYAVIDEAWLDFDANTAEMWCHGAFDIKNNAFPSAIFTIRLGDGIHVFRNTIDFFFSYSSGASTQLVVEPGEGTLILWPRGRQIMLLP